LLLSEERVTQTPLQRICPLGQLGAQRPPLQLLLWQSALTPHDLPSAHFGQLPPQSMSLSPPFLTPSLQVAWQTPLAQGWLGRQACPHWPQFDVSVASTTQVPLQGVFPAAQGEQTRSTQFPLVQSRPVMQALPSPQEGQVPPPQSVSDSAPFFMPSLQVGMHCPPRHGWSATQVVAQSPQCWVSLLVLTHAPLQFVNPVPQMTSQWPSTQIGVEIGGEVQTWLHPPQFATSSVRCRQSPLQFV
jgi:hypothetical protein